MRCQESRHRLHTWTRRAGCLSLLSRSSARALTDLSKPRFLRLENGNNNSTFSGCSVTSKSDVVEKCPVNVCKTQVRHSLRVQMLSAAEETDVKPSLLHPPTLPGTQPPHRLSGRYVGAQWSGWMCRMCPCVLQAQPVGFSHTPFSLPP